MATRSTPSSQKAPRYQKPKRTGKKPLPGPTHIGHFISILIVSLCKKVLLIETSTKIGVYLCGTLVGSVFSDLFALPKSYFSNKKNILNRFFVGFGFGWTFTLLFAFIFLTSFVYMCGNWKNVIRKHMIRLAIAAFWWIVMTKTFEYVDSVVGECTLSTLKQKRDCVKAGKLWLGFDISGHVFLLIHNLLTISEEVKSFKYWSTLDSMLKEEDIALKKNLTEQQVSQARVSFTSLTPYIKIVVVLLTVWTIFCEFMLIISIVYRFHTLIPKIVASFVAVGCWFITYRLLLEIDMDLLPSQPGDSPFRFMKVIKKQKLA